jgi:hypothetical protein
LAPFVPMISIVRVVPFTRVGAVLIIALTTSAAGAASAGAISVAGISVPGTDNVHLPTVPSVNLPQVPGAPAPVNNAVDTVNGVTNNAANTVNGAVGGATGALPSTGSGSGSSSSPSGSSSTGSGNGTPAGGGSNGTAPSGGSGNGPNAGGGSGQGGSNSRRAANRKRAGTRGRTPARSKRARRAAAARGGAGLAAAKSFTGHRSGGKVDDSAGGNPVSRVINRIEQVIPGPVKALIGVLALLALGFGVRSWLATRRARKLERHRAELMGDVGLLQRALLPDVPGDLRGIDVSVAYRPAEGPAAGGDFYDVFELDRGRTAIIVGDVCGHGRAALAVTALMRYTLRAYLGAGFEPRVALQVAARSLDGDPEGALTTVVLAIYDPDAGTLTYACAGHEPPIVLGPAEYEPVTAFSSPPLGGFMLTGLRQTTVGLPPGSSVCFFTDGLVEARLGNDMIGRRRLTEVLAELEPDAGAQLLLDRIAQSADRAPDDMAACLVRARDSALVGPSERVEQLAADSHDLADDRPIEFLKACGVDLETAVEARRAARAKAAEFGAVLIQVVVNDGRARVEVAPSETAMLPVPSLEAARRAALDEVPAEL